MDECKCKEPEIKLTVKVTRIGGGHMELSCLKCKITFDAKIIKEIEFKRILTPEEEEEMRYTPEETKE